VVDSYKHANEPSGSVEGWEFLDQLSSYKFLNDCSMELAT
jgi:hypothetical protein